MEVFMINQTTEQLMKDSSNLKDLELLLLLRLALFGIKHAVLSHDIYDFLESKSLIFFETT